MGAMRWWLCLRAHLVTDGGDESISRLIRSVEDLDDTNSPARDSGRGCVRSGCSR